MFLHVLLIAIFTAGPAFTGTASEPEKAAIYNPDLDVKTEISRSLIRALDENKHLLLMFGGNWCPWCHKLHDLLTSNEDIRKYLADHFILILVDVGEKAQKPLNQDLVEKYTIRGFGYPSLSVLDTKGRLISAQSTGILEKGRFHDPDRIMAFLKAQAPRLKE